MNTTTKSRIDQITWGEREYRLAFTVWLEPGINSVGEAIDEDPILEVIDRIRRRDEISEEEAEAGRQIAPHLDDIAPVERALRWLDGHQDVRFVMPGDRDWPRELNDLGGARPYGLWLRGDIRSQLTQYAICIDGCRASTDYGDHIAAQLAADLATQGYSLVTGAARGIQRVALRASLSVGGTPILVLAAGMDSLYPPRQTDFLHRALGQGVVIVTEIPPGSYLTSARFASRRRLMAGLSEATVIVEAGAGSGSLATADQASNIFRAVGVVPGPVTSATSVGCHDLLRVMDTFIVTCAHDIIEEVES